MTDTYQRHGVSGTASAWQIYGYQIGADGVPEPNSFSGIDSRQSEQALLRAGAGAGATVGQALEILSGDRKAHVAAAGTRQLATAIGALATAIGAESAEGLIARLPERMREYVKTVHRS